MCVVSADREESLLEVCRRFIGVTALALFFVITSGFKKSFRAEWKRVFEKDTGSVRWADIPGAVLPAGFLSIVALGIHQAAG